MRFTTGAETEIPDEGVLLNSQLDSLRGLALHLLATIESIKEGSQREVKREIPLHEAVRRYEANLLCKAPIITRGNRPRAARLLGVKLTTLRKTQKVQD